MRVDTDLVELIGHRISDITVKLPNVAAVNPIEILRWPGVVQQPEVDVEPLFTEATRLLDTTLASIGRMRSSTRPESCSRRQNTRTLTAMKTAITAR